MREYVFDLYITGHTSRSRQAARCIQELCDKCFPGNYTLNIIDVLEDPLAAEQEKIIATPTLVQRAPSSGRRIVGVSSDPKDMLRALGLDADFEETTQQQE